LFQKLWTQRDEWFCYSAYATHPSRLISCLIQTGKAASQRVMGDAVPLLYRGCVKPDVSQAFFSGRGSLAFPAIGSKAQGSQSLEQEFSLPLASSAISFQEFQDLIQAPRNALEPEDALSLHRFPWLLYVLTQSPFPSNIQEAFRCIENWMRMYPAHPGGIGWDAYSVSERIVHWTIFLCGLRAFPTLQQSVEKVISSALPQHVAFLRQHLEFHGSRTNNHVINNARALYIGGMLVKDSDSVGVGRDILITAISEQFTSSGFLREGSSHYHILLCRSYLEVLWVARWAQDVLFYDQIRPAINEMLKAAEFYLAFPEFPLIGDVSPDFNPAYHLGLLQGAQNILEDFEAPWGKVDTSDGWDQLFASHSEPKDFEVKTLSVVPPIQSYPDAGYYRITFSDYSLLFYSSALGYIPAWSHGHGDIGSFLLYWKDQLLFVDCGRVTYADDSWGRYGRSVRSHNGLSIDRREPCIVHGLNAFPELMHPNYFSQAPEVHIEQPSQARIVVKITNHSYGRLSNVGEVTRSFICEPERLMIEDYVQGKSVHHVGTFFHFHPQVKVQDHSETGAKISLPNETLHFKIQSGAPSRSVLLRAQGSPDPAGWYFPSYGEQVPTATLRVEQQAELPLVNQYILESAD
jgi:Heparinase II/III-like protein